MGPLKVKRQGTAPSYRKAITGHKALALMNLLRPMMGERRTRAIDEALAIGVEKVLKPVPGQARLFGETS